MKTNLFCLATAILLMTAMSACAPTRTNAEIVLKMVEEMNAGDLEGSLAYFAEDAVMYLYGFPPTGFERYTRTAGIPTVWSDSIAANFEWQVEIQSEEGNLVFVEAQTWHDFTRSLGVAPLAYHDVYEVVDGKIVTYVSWLTADAYARFRPAFDAAMTLDPPA